jgi:gamma-glutamyltranspeptidase / glutathione hydrolase
MTESRNASAQESQTEQERQRDQRRNPAITGYDRPIGPPHQSGSVVLGRNGIVASSHPWASQVGLDVLRRGGNAVDAAIAVNAMLGLVEPMSCGIGGDLFAIVWDSKTQKIYGLNASGRSPASISRDEFRKRKLEKIPLDGLLSWSVPGCVSGWEELAERFGARPLGELLAPSIEAAEDGFPVTEVIAHYWKGAETALAKWPDSAATYLVDGRAPRFGEVFRNPNLAKSYRRIAEKGAAAFYEGEIAQTIADFSQDNDGYLTLDDLREHASEWIEPVSSNYRGYDVWELPPNGQGIAVLQMLNILEGYDLKSLRPGDPQWIHLFTEAKKLAFADRAKYYADLSMADVPVARLISKEYAAQRRKLIDLDRAAQDVAAGDEQLAHGDTIYLTVVDKDRNCCSLIQSNYYGFGSKVTPGDVGFVIQNRGALFALDEKHRNTLEPRKRPFHTIIPALVTKDGKPWFCFGVMGGDMQPQGHVQVLVNLIDFGLNVQAAGDASRVEHVGSATPTGEPAKGVGALLVESGISDETIEVLRKRGHVVNRVATGNGGGYQGILIDWQNGVLQGATEARKDGAALGY